METLQRATPFDRAGHSVLQSPGPARVRGALVQSSELRQSIAAALHSALRAGANSGRVGESAREALAVASDIARRQQLRAEQLLLAVKAEWRTLPELQRVLHADADEILSKVITQCIKEYYRPINHGV